MCDHLRHIQNEISQAYTQEIGAVRRQYRRHPIWIDNLHHTGRLGEEPYYYRARVLTDDAGGGLMEGVEIRILYHERPFHGPPEEVSQIGKLLVYDRRENQVIFSTQGPIDPYGPDPRLRLEPLVHRLLETIRQRVSAPNLFQDSPLPAQIIHHQFFDQFQYQNLVSDHKNLNQHQKNAIEAVRTKDLSLIWGPPGTGKTEVLGRLTTELVRIGKRVLCLAVSNVAIDQFALRAARIAEGDIDPQKKFVRFGQPRLPEVIQNDYLFPNRREVDDIRSRIQGLRQLKEQTNDLNEQARLQERLTNAQTELRNAILAPLSYARAVFTTVIQVGIEDLFLSVDPFDVVIVDEVSMLPIGHLLFLASIPSEKIVLAGDFKQLSPIAVSNHGLVQTWLKQDIFAWLHIHHNQGEHDRMTMLSLQYRMHPEICRIISDTFYFGKLKADISTHDNHLANQPPGEGVHVLIADMSTATKRVICERTETGSRYNVRNGEVTVEIAHRLIRRAHVHSVAIIAPYRWQVRLIQNSFRDIFQQDRTPDQVRRKLKIGTVHAFQGDESDIIIFDLVDTPRSLPSKIWSDRPGLELLNVGISRAKGKLILVGHPDLFRHAQGYGAHHRILSRYFRNRLRLPDLHLIPGQEVLEEPDVIQVGVLFTASRSDDPNAVRQFRLVEHGTLQRVGGVDLVPRHTPLGAASLGRQVGQSFRVGRIEWIVLKIGE